MQIKVDELYETVRTKYGLKLHCGKDGMSNPASWVYLAEDIQNLPFLKGGELIITTGLFTQSGVMLCDFIRALAIHNCSGVVLNIGRYLSLKDITPEIVSFCDINRIPLFTIPWETHLADIMQELCSQFLREKQREDQLSMAFQSAIYHEKVPLSILLILNQYGFTTQAHYFVVVIRNLENASRITLPLNSYGLKYHLFPHDNLHILIYNSAQKQLSLNEVIEIVCFHDGITVGAGDPVHSLAEIGMAYKCARFCLAAAELWKRQSVLFEELGVFRLLFYVPDRNYLQAYYQRQLGELEQYDLKHGSDYMQTLQIFLLSDCNLLKTAEIMHTHRNTIVYRIRKIKELLHSELDNSAIKFELMMSLYIKEYLSM